MERGDCAAYHPASAYGGVRRFDDVKPNVPINGRRFSAQWIALSPAAAVQLINRMRRVAGALAQAGVLKATPK